MKVFFELYPPTVSDTGHFTTSLMSDHLIQFAKAVGLEGIHASYDLSEGSLVRSRGVGIFGLRGSNGRFHLPTSFSSSVGDSMPSE